MSILKTTASDNSERIWYEIGHPKLHNEVLFCIKQYLDENWSTEFLYSLVNNLSRHITSLSIYREWE